MKHLFALAVMAALYAPAAQAEAMKPLAASEFALPDLLYTSRALVVFAPAAEDPRFIRQMELLAIDNGDLAARDVVLIVDTDPAAKSAIRTQLRPSGFSLVILDKDGRTALRKPQPWSLREITRAIDKFPSRRGEMLERLPAGR
jgi:hypothetical protein